MLTRFCANAYCNAFNVYPVTLWLPVAYAFTWKCLYITLISSIPRFYIYNIYKYYFAKHSCLLTGKIKYNKSITYVCITLEHVMCPTNIHIMCYLLLYYTTLVFHIYLKLLWQQLSVHYWYVQDIHVFRRHVILYRFSVWNFVAKFLNKYESIVRVQDSNFDNSIVKSMNKKHIIF